MDKYQPNPLDTADIDLPESLVELIEKMAEELGLVADPKYKSENFVPDAKSDEQLLELGLIKQIQ